MFNLSGSEIVVILLLALVVLGPEKLPDALKRAGRTYAELKKMGNSFQEEVKSALDEPMKEMRDTADLLRKAADFTDVAAPTATPGSGNRATPAPKPTPAPTPTPTPDAEAGSPSATALEAAAATAASDIADTADIADTDAAPPFVDVIPAEDLDADLVNRTLSGGAPAPTVMPDTAIGSVTVEPADAAPRSSADADGPPITAT